MEATGFLHIHTMDEERPIEALAERHIRQGYHFTGVVDHPNEISAAEFERRRDSAEACTTPSYVCLYGVEGPTRSGPHVLALGLREWMPLWQLTLAEVIRNVRAQGGISVVAHIRADEIAAVAALSELPDGIEVWNALRCGWGPDPRVMRGLARDPRLGTLPKFGGPDAHRPSHLFKIATVVEVEQLTPEALSSSLQQGSFQLRRGPLQMSARERRAFPPLSLLHAPMRAAQKALRRAKRAVPRDSPLHGSPITKWLERSI